jgi:hypothetical protein
MIIVEIKYTYLNSDYKIFVSKLVNTDLVLCFLSTFRNCPPQFREMAGRPEILVVRSKKYVAFENLSAYFVNPLKLKDHIIVLNYFTLFQIGVIEKRHLKISPRTHTSTSHTRRQSSPKKSEKVFFKPSKVCIKDCSQRWRQQQWSTTKKKWLKPSRYQRHEIFIFLCHVTLFKIG